VGATVGVEVGVGLAVGVAVGVGVGVEVIGHSVIVTESRRQPADEVLLSLSIRHSRTML
jgi:type IV secretory pathway TrbD component